MEGIFEAFRDFVAWLVGGIIAAMGAWGAWITVKVNANATRIAMLEQAANEIPGQLSELKNLIEQMRTESRARGSAIYKHIDEVRKELKADINRESDKRQH